ncbi:hypothetical protein MJO29_004367 [Puccinia striiformis f. sp. tritici]|nr:hypothetical protein MJO29_004367 [Puccinia striiformis f. sp. tritici]
MKRTRKRPRQSSPTRSSSPPGPSDARAQSTESDPIDPDIVVMDDDRSTAPRTSRSNSGRELTDAEELPLADESHKKLLHPTILKNLPSAKVLSRSIHMIYTAFQDSYREVLKKHVGAMYLGADAWQSPNGHDILGIVIYWLVEKDGAKFELEAMPLNFVWLVKSHTGKYLAETLRLVVEKFGVQDKICGIVTDNASNNSSMVAELKKFKWPRFKGDPHWIRCFAHILNLIVQSILRPFGKVVKKSIDTGDLDNTSEEGPNDGDAEVQICRYSDNASTCDKDEPDDVEDSEDDGNETQETELLAEDIVDLSDEDEEEDAYTSASCKHTLPKFHAIARKLRKSPNSKAEFLLLCEEQECTKPHNIKRDVRTRWNSTYFQLEGIIRCEKAILIWQKHRKYGLARHSTVVFDGFLRTLEYRFVEYSSI